MAEEPESPKRKRRPKLTEEEKARRERFMKELNSTRGDKPPLTYHRLSIRLTRAVKKIEERERLITQGLLPAKTPWAEYTEEEKSLEIDMVRIRWKKWTEEQKLKAISEDPELLEAAGLWPEKPKAKRRRN